MLGSSRCSWEQYDFSYKDSERWPCFTFVISVLSWFQQKSSQGYDKFCEGEMPKLKEVMSFWKGVTADQLDEMGRRQCEIYRTDVEPGDLVWIPAGMLIHERVVGTQVNYSLKMGLLYTNHQYPRSVENYTDIYNVLSAGVIKHKASNKQ